MNKKKVFLVVAVTFVLSLLLMCSAAFVISQIVKPETEFTTSGPASTPAPAMPDSQRAWIEGYDEWNDLKLDVPALRAAKTDHFDEQITGFIRRHNISDPQIANVSIYGGIMLFEIVGGDGYSYTLLLVYEDGEWELIGYQKVNLNVETNWEGLNV